MLDVLVSFARKLGGHRLYKPVSVALPIKGKWGREPREESLERLL